MTPDALQFLMSRPHLYRTYCKWPFSHTNGTFCSSVKNIVWAHFSLGKTKVYWFCVPKILFNPKYRCIICWSIIISVIINKYFLKKIRNCTSLVWHNPNPSINHTTYGNVYTAFYDIFPTKLLVMLISYYYIFHWAPPSSPTDLQMLN